MLKLLLLTAMTSPLAFTIFHSGKAIEAYKVSVEIPVYEEVAEDKLRSLRDCKPAAFSVIFFEQYIETHSSAYLADAAQAASACNMNEIIVRQLVPTNTTAEKMRIFDERSYEIKAIINSYYPSQKVKINKVSVGFSVDMVHSRPLKIKFDVSPISKIDS